MKRAALPIFLATLPGVCAWAALPSEWNSRIAALFAAQATGELAVSEIVGVISPSGTDLMAFGAARPESLFEIGSVTKSFTGIALAELSLQGAAALTDPVSRWMPELDGTFAGAIRLQDLATHRSGLPRMPSPFAPKDWSNPYADYTRDEMIGFLKGYVPAGTGPFPKAYSNLGFMLLGEVISRIDGKPLAASLEARIAQALGLSDTVAAESQAQASRFLDGFDVAQQITPHWTGNVLLGAGGLRSTATDMMKFLAANLSPDLSTPLGRAMQLSQSELLGWDNRAGASITWKNGGTGGFRSWIGFDRARGIGSVMLKNEASDEACIELVPFGIACDEATDFPLTEAQMTKAVGHYLHAPSKTWVDLGRPGHFLIADYNGESRLRLRAVSETEFKIDESEDQVTLELDTTTGKVTALVYHEAQGNTTPPKDFRFARQ